MRVFISWSGELSLVLAEVFRSWLPSTLQFVKPYFSPKDIDKGTKWASEIAKELAASSVCIIVLTKENLNSNWIMFEAGAISTALDNARVCPIIFNVQPADLRGPLAQFQITNFNKEDICKLFKMINAQAGESKLQDAVAESVFEKWWPDLQDSIQKALSTGDKVQAKETARSERDILEEILLLTRGLEKERQPAPTRSVVVPYSNSLFSQIMKLINTLWAECSEGWSVFGGPVSEIRDFVATRTSDHVNKTKFLEELDEFIRDNSPRTLRRRVKASDDIPF